MSKRKATFITAVIMVLLTSLLICIWKFGRGFDVFEGIFAGYGYIRFAMDACRWMQMPDVELLQSNTGRRARR